MHSQQSYMVGRTKIMADPRGYVIKHRSPKSRPSIENRQFNPRLVVEVDSELRPGYSAADIDNAWDHPDIFLSRVSDPPWPSLDEDPAGTKR